MNWLDKLEQKWGRYAIPNITRFAVVAVLVGYLINMLGTGAAITQLCSFSGYHILRGQIWRLFTWIFIPTSSMSILSLLFVACLLMLGSSMESYLGTFRMNVYFFGGILISDIGGLLIYLIFHLPVHLTPYYILFSMYLMLGLFMPEAVILVSFVFPVKMKWMVVVYILEIIYEIYCNFKIGAAYGDALSYGIALSAEIVLAMINLGIFVYSCKHHLSLKQRRRKKNFQAQFSQPRPGSGISHHKCCICGRTELDDPTLTFRYCSKCAGNREYCQEHLFTHEHRN